MSSRFLRFFTPACLVYLLIGCSGAGGRVEAPDISPEGAGQQALAEYDLNHDGVLDAKELERCPALKGSLKKIDTNGDGKLSAQEITDRVSYFQQTKTGLMSFPCQVLLDGKPLAGATITFEPEKFLGPAMKPAGGVSDEDGLVLLKTEGFGFSGVQCGFFRVKVSKTNFKGQETIPAKYNAQTTLGQEVAPDFREAMAVFRLASK